MISTQTRISSLLTLAIEIPPARLIVTVARSIVINQEKCRVRILKMHSFLPVLLAVVVCGFFSLGNAAIAPPAPLKYEIANKEIRLKHGQLHPHVDQTGVEDDEHVVYRYRWVEDDIVKTEGEFDGEIDEEYTDKEKKVKLPGGCELTEDQFLELESFKKETLYVKNCYCEQGGVYCQLKKTFFKENLI